MNSSSTAAPNVSPVASGWILLGAFALLLSLSVGIYAAASRLDRDSRVREEQLIANGMAFQGDEVRRLVASVTVWDDAVRHLDTHFDAAWAQTYIAHYFWSTDGYELVDILGGDDQPVFASEAGREVGLSNYAPLAAQAAPLVALIRAREAARGPLTAMDNRVLPSIDASTIVRRGGKIYLLVASLVQPDHTTRAEPSPRAPIMVVGEEVDPTFIANLGRRYLLDDARLAPPGAATPAGYDSVPLERGGDPNSFRIAWHRRSPVNNLLFVAGPPLAAVFLALAFAPVLIIRNERRNRALILASRDALLASEAKSAFLATMSHEIRTPLNGVLGTAQAILRDDLPPLQRERVEIVRTSGLALLAILNDVLDIAKIESGKLDLETEPFELEILLDSARGAFTALVGEKGLNFDLVIDPDVRGVYAGDALRVRQILSNLISNAVKFTEQGGVTVEVGPAPGGISFVITDSGVGIAADRVGQVFERFTQADSSTTRRFGGTGLGLAICRDLCTAMGGTIDVESTLGVGTRVAVVLPLPRVPNLPAPLAALATPAAHFADDLEDARPLRVLAAEDNRVNQLVLKTLLEQAGIEPVIVDDGAAAVERWRSGDWDLVLMDVQMPVMDGPGATRAIRRLEAQMGRPRTTIIALTANVMKDQTDAYLAAGMDGVIAKPIDVAELYSAIEGSIQEPVQSAGFGEAS